MKCEWAFHFIFSVWFCSIKQNLPSNCPTTTKKVPFQPHSIDSKYIIELDLIMSNLCHHLVLKRVNNLTMWLRWRCHCHVIDHTYTRYHTHECKLWPMFTQKQFSLMVNCIIVDKFEYENKCMCVYVAHRLGVVKIITENLVKSE